MIIRLAILVSLLLFPQQTLRADMILDFGTATSTQGLPYSEDGFTFTSLQGNSGIIGTTLNSNRYLNLVGAPVGSNVTVRLAGTVPFDLNSVVIRGFGVARNWAIVASNGSTFNLPNGTPGGTLDFTALAGWSNLNYVDLIHNQSAANANLQLDNFNVSLSVVPEPSSALLVGVAVLATRIQRWRSSRKR